MLKRPRQTFLPCGLPHAVRAVLTAFLFAGLSANTIAQAKLGALEKKLDEVSQKIELLDKVRAAENKALEDRIDVKKDLADVRSAIAANALSVADVKKEVAANGQKSIDWWFAGLAIFMAIFSVAIPVVFTWNLRAKHKAQIEEIERMRKEIEATHAATQSAASAINALHQTAQEKTKEFDDALKTLLASSPIEGPTDGAAAPLERTAVTSAAAKVAESKEAELADRLFARGVQTYQAGNYDAAAAHFASVLAERPHDRNALSRLGTALGKLADAAKGNERRRLRLEAISKYEAALIIKPDEHVALNNLGTALSKLADAATGDERRRLRLEAISKYEAALKVKPDKAVTLKNFGSVLGKLADAAEGDERRRLCLEAVSKYEAALKVKLDDDDTLDRLGGALSKLADAAEGEERRMRMAEAEDVLQRHKTITGHASYNLACLIAKRGDVNRFIEIADALPPAELPNASRLRVDKDLDVIRESTEFKAWWKRQFGDEAIAGPST